MILHKASQPLIFVSSFVKQRNKKYCPGKINVKIKWDGTGALNVYDSAWYLISQSLFIVFFHFLCLMGL